MAVKLRLQRTGHRNHTQFRVVAADKRHPRDGNFIELLGWSDPHGKGVISEDLKLDRVEYWKSVGAEVSHPVKQIIRRVKNRKPEDVEAKAEAIKAAKAAAQAPAPAVVIEKPAPEAAPAEVTEKAATTEES